MKKAFIFILMLATLPAFAQRRPVGAPTSSSKKAPPLAPSYAWRVVEPLGLREPCEMDTVELNYYQQAVPSAESSAWVCTGNLGGEGENMIWTDRLPIGDFFLSDALRTWMPSAAKQKFYNTRTPMTILSYNTGGSRDNTQDRLSTIFSGNINAKAQVGANLDYIYSKGSYQNQSTKDLIWGLSGSYLGDRYEFQGFFSHYNLLNKENGGITDDRYITDPAELQGGVSSISPRSIPVNLNHAHTRVAGTEVMLNNRYKIGFWHEEHDSIDTDSVIKRTYVPVTSVIWTLGFRQGRHLFHDDNAAETDKFFEHTYLNNKLTEDRTKFMSLRNTVGIALLEGFNKYAKFGLSAYATYEIRRFNQTADTLDRSKPEDAGLTPFPDGISSISPKGSENLLWIGAQLTKQRGSILRYEATGEIGVVGAAAGEIKAHGRVATRIPLFGDTVELSGYGRFTNLNAPYLLDNYVSNHFVWRNDFGKERRVKFGGELEIPWSATRVNVGVENVQNLLYFDDNALPAQFGGSIQVLSATLDQRLKLGILHWDNKVTYQQSSNEAVLSLPKLAVYSNLYILCRIATLKLQLGVDCDYYTKYYAPAYQPATATFHNQREIKLGNYPFMNLYANCKLGKTRFYVMMTHINQGMFGDKNYFSSPHYPLNPRRLLLGLSVDFAN